VREIRITLLTLEGDEDAEREVAHQLQGAGPVNERLGRETGIVVRSGSDRAPGLGAALERIRDDPQTNLVLSRAFIAARGVLQADDTLRSLSDEMRFSLVDIAALSGARGERGVSPKFLVTGDIFAVVGSYVAERSFRGVWISSVKGVGRPSLTDFLDDVRVRYFFALIEGAADRFMPKP
jgi:hypothetical protein